MFQLSARPAPSGQLLELLHPRGHGRGIAAALVAGALLGGLAAWQLGLPSWSAPAMTLGLLLAPLALKWRADRRSLGTPAMVLSILLISQGLHSIEHISQWVQYHLLGWPLKSSGGLISPLNSEIVHFSWNMLVLALIIYLVSAGMRGVWMWLLLLWAGAHTAEHIYLFIRFLGAVWELQAAGLPLDAAQGLPGIIGRGGWLASSAETSASARFLCNIAPGLANAPRLDVHFWWNAGELALLIAAAMRCRLPGKHEA